jgi:uncharacterized protein YqeY
MLEEKILNDYKEAMKAKDALKSSILNFLRSDLKYAAIAKKKDALEDQDVITVIKKHVKQHQDSIEQFKKGNRQDLVDKESKELEILKAYLPEEMPVEEIKKIIEEAIVSTGAQDIKDMGKVMKEANAKIAGRAEGKVVSELVKQRLSKTNEEEKK